MEDREMTEEKAIKGLKETLCSLCDCVSQNMDNCDIKECDNRDYIKALEQQPTSDDCVSRQAVLECLTATGLKKFDFILDAREKVNNLPPVRPTRKVGKWIKTGGSFRCSKCMVMPEFKDIRTLKYCPNCSAEMRGIEK